MCFNSLVGRSRSFQQELKNKRPKKQMLTQLFSPPSVRNDWLGFQIKTRVTKGYAMVQCQVRTNRQKGFRSIGSSFLIFLNASYYYSICSDFVSLLGILLWFMYEFIWKLHSMRGCVSPFPHLPFLLQLRGFLLISFMRRTACLSVSRALKMTHYLLPFEDFGG